LPASASAAVSPVTTSEELLVTGHLVEVFMSHSDVIQLEPSVLGRAALRAIELLEGIASRQSRSEILRLVCPITHSFLGLRLAGVAVNSK
jgi:hypothetical protein